MPPNQDLGANIFTGLQCTPNPVFLPRTYFLPAFPAPLDHLLPASVTFAPVHLHALVLATFASLIAPFGGFFASGLKRTFKVKDFGDSIPGHGGMTDRMDCQFIMGFFAFMYYQSFIAVYKANVGMVIEQAITGLSTLEQIEVVKGLSKHLVNQGVISPMVSVSRIVFGRAMDADCLCRCLKASAISCNVGDGVLGFCGPASANALHLMKDYIMEQLTCSVFCRY